MATPRAKEFWKRYQVDEKEPRLGEGRYGSVRRALDTATGEIVAIKKTVMEDGEDGLPSTAMREISVLRVLAGSPNIIKSADPFGVDDGLKLHEVFYDFDTETECRECNLVFECMSCDLRKYIIEHKDPFPPEMIKSLMLQLCKGLESMHIKGFMHRDLKPQNILINKTKPEAPVLKIADLGLGRTHSLPIQELTHEIGSLHYRPPEVLLGTKSYGHAVDMWSVGCIFAELFNRKTLFYGQSEIHQLLAIFQILGTPSGDSWPESLKLRDWHPFPEWKENSLRASFEDGIDDTAFDLISKLLSLDPCKRINVVDALKHPYFIEDTKENAAPTEESNST